MSIPQEYAYVLYWLAIRKGVYYTGKEISDGVVLPESFIFAVLNDLAAISVIDVEHTEGVGFYAFVGE